MDNLRGEKLDIHSYKHNGHPHRTWDEAILLDETNEYMVFGNNKTKVIITSGEVPMVNKVNMINSDIVTNIFIKPYNYEELCSSIDLLCKESSTNNDELIGRRCMYTELRHCCNGKRSKI